LLNYLHNGVRLQEEEKKPPERLFFSEAVQIVGNGKPPYASFTRYRVARFWWIAFS
jgi:hypothetical protein